VHVQVLYLGGNQLRFLPDEIGELRRLESLNVSDNQLSTVPQTLSRLRRLKSLYLHGNVLRTLPVEIVKLKRLAELSLRGNPLVVKFVTDMAYEPPTLLELAGRDYLDSARECVNPCCRGVYFTSRVEHVKFVDFCGKFRVPLLQYLCSPRCNDVQKCCTAQQRATMANSSTSGSSDEEDANANTSYLTRMMKKVLLG
jgi:hypothetical protein